MSDELDLFTSSIPASMVPALGVPEVILDPVFGKRRDALLRTVPLHDLVDRTPPQYQGFDVRALALAAFDAVIARQGFSAPATPAQVAELLAGIAGVQQPTSNGPTRFAIAEHVLDGLTNRRERHSQFTYESILYQSDEAGRVMAVAATRPFWLLREMEDPASGGVYLRASVDAINALVGGLDLPVEDEQAAAELILERQLARGDLDSAYVSAERARRLSVGFTAKIDDLLTETHRYLPGLDWKVAAPQLIENALAHIDDCLDRETRLLAHIEAGRERQSPEDRTSRAKAVVADRLMTLLRETKHLHTALLRRLMSARLNFLDAQDAQMFRPLPVAVELDLMTDILVPTVSLHRADSDLVVNEYLRATLGPMPPKLVNWGEVIGSLLRPNQRTSGTSPEPNTDDQYRPDPPRLISAELLAQTQHLTAAVRLPARLSTLLAATPARIGKDAAPFDLIVAAALRAYDNGARDLTVQHAELPHSDVNAGVQILDVLGPDRAAHSDGTPLSGDGWSGDDLIVCADRDQLDAVLRDELPTPDPVPLPDLRGTR